MATLIPALNSCLRRMTSGERRLAQRLVDKLEDDYLCWYEVPVGKRQELNPDFIILHPRRGILVLEIKDWQIDTIKEIDRESVRLLTPKGLKSSSLGHVLYFDNLASEEDVVGKGTEGNVVAPVA